MKTHKVTLRAELSGQQNTVPTEAMALHQDDGCKRQSSRKAQEMLQVVKAIVFQPAAKLQLLENISDRRRNLPTLPRIPVLADPVNGHFDHVRGQDNNALAGSEFGWYTGPNAGH